MLSIDKGPDGGPEIHYTLKRPVKDVALTFSLSNTQHIAIEPVVHLMKVVVLNPPDHPGNLTATYPNGSREDIPDISPDYDKLLSMK